MMNYCPHCSHPVEHLVPEGDNRTRAVCGNCDSIHYKNPLVVTGTIPVWENRILLCRRNIEPRKGFWTLPAGFLELDETSEQGAERETWEEAMAPIEIRRLHGVYNIPHVNQIYMLYLADLKSPTFAITPESCEVALFDYDQIPWPEMAFRVIEQSLRDFLSDPDDAFTVFHKTIQPTVR